MKSLVQSLALLTILLSFNSCTTVVDPGPATTTTTRTTDATYVPGGSVTTQKTTTTY